MSVSFSGVYLPWPGDEVALAIESDISLADVIEFTYRRWAGSGLIGTSFPGTVPDRPVKLGSLYWPRGAARWSTFHWVITDDLLYQIGGVGQGQLVLTDDNNPGATVAATMSMLPPRPLYQVPGWPEAKLYLLTLVCSRFASWQAESGAFQVTEGTTSWHTLFGGLSVQHDAISGSYGLPSGSLNRGHQPVPPLADCLAYNVGQRIICRLNGTIFSQGSSQASGQFAGNLLAFAPGPSATPKEAGGLFDVPVLGAVPSGVQIAFPRADNLVAAVNLNHFYVPAPNQFYTSGSGKTYVDTACALYLNGALQNQAVLDAIRQQLGGDNAVWWTQQADLKLAGIVPWIIEALSDAVEWCCRGSEMWTRIYPCQADDLTWELNHATTGIQQPPTYESITTLANSNGCVQVYNSNVGGQEEGVVYVPHEYVHYSFAIGWTAETAMAGWDGFSSEIFYTGAGNETLGALIRPLLDGEHVWIENAGAYKLAFTDSGGASGGIIVPNPNKATYYPGAPPANQWIIYSKQAGLLFYHQLNDSYYPMWPDVFVRSGPTATTGLVPQPPTTVQNPLTFLCEDGGWRPVSGGSTTFVTITVTNIFVDNIVINDYFAITWITYNNLTAYDGSASEIYYLGSGQTVVSLHAGLADGQHLWIYNPGPGTILWQDESAGGAGADLEIPNPFKDNDPTKVSSLGPYFYQYPENGSHWKWIASLSQWVLMDPDVFIGYSQGVPTTGLVPAPPNVNNLWLKCTATWEPLPGASLTSVVLELPNQYLVTQNWAAVPGLLFGLPIGTWRVWADATCAIVFTAGAPASVSMRLVNVATGAVLPLSERKVASTGFNQGGIAGASGQGLFVQSAHTEVYYTVAAVTLVRLEAKWTATGLAPMPFPGFPLLLSNNEGRTVMAYEKWS